MLVLVLILLAVVAVEAFALPFSPWVFYVPSLVPADLTANGHWDSRLGVIIIRPGDSRNSRSCDAHRSPERTPFIRSPTIGLDSVSQVKAQDAA